MATLTEGQRVEVWGDAMRGEVAVFGNLSKNDLKAAVDAIDSWVDSNAAAFNSAIPNPARTQLTTKQKAMLLLYVVEKRWRVG